MTLTGASVRAALLEQTERTRGCSKAEIERFIGEYELESISIESQIAALMEPHGSQPMDSESHLTSLIELRDSQRACVLALRYIASPIFSLPVESLAEIFEHTVWNWMDLHTTSHVCSYWRQVAHSTPRLWTRPPKVDLYYKKEDVSHGFKAWFTRSASLPVDISLVPGPTNNTSLLAEVLKIAPRCHSLQILDDRGPVPSWIVRQFAECKLVNLEELGVGAMDGDGTDYTSVSFTDVPRLRKCNLVKIIPPEILVPWTQITELNLECFSLDGAFEVFSQFTNLINASVEFIGKGLLPGVRPDIPVRLGHLRSLSILLGAEFTPFFDYLSTPVLGKLSLDLGEAHWTEVHFTAFQLRAPNITQLEFANSHWFSSNNLVAAIRHAPSLTYLKLNNCNDECFDDAFIRSLHYQEGLPPLVPRLHNLVVEIKSTTKNFTDDVLAGVISSRWWTESELASLAAPPLVARWTRVELRTQHKFGPHFADALKDIPPDVLIYEVHPESDYNLIM